MVPGLYSSFPWICVFLLLFLRIHFLCPVPHDKRLAICLQFYCPSHCPFFSSLKKMGESVFFLLIPSIVILIMVVEFSPSDPFLVCNKWGLGIYLRSKKISLPVYILCSLNQFYPNTASFLLKFNRIFCYGTLYSLQWKTSWSMSLKRLLIQKKLLLQPFLSNTSIIMQVCVL